jgi:hypothetical protein
MHTSTMSKELFSKYYQDHEKHFTGLQNFVLHLHAHFSQLFDDHGGLCNIGTFGQENFIGKMSKNHHGTRYHGDLLKHYYEVSIHLGICF